ncbi:hypothetical protein Q73_02730 [Bacillus coahuilensis m2-6]|uniref:phosphotransferase n=1 Tax=Bacillus coahuilensis TaxID=408580 RepID=UPI0007503DF4|nr:phosphotransferase [Bacillus coahuilensis]KUP09548.1 hypothetical protein Q73_02730 [Bacillus coahuilensis m2-6]
MHRKIGEGNTAEVYLWVNDTVLKLFHEGTPLKEIEKELITSKMINETGLPTPKVFGVEEYFGRTGIIYQYIEGPSLFVANYSPMDMLDLLLKLQDSIHKIAAHHFPSLKDRLMQKIMAVFSLTLEEKQKWIEVIQQLPNGNTLCHGDFHPLNVMVTENGPVLIDWADATCGHPYGDIARTYILVRFGGMSHPLEEEIRLREQLADAYLRKCNVNRKEFERWLVPVACARLMEGIGEWEREVLLQMVRMNGEYLDG